MENMQKYEYLLTEIDDIRKSMYVIIERGSSLTDIEVVEVSQRLDSLLNEYINLAYNKSVQVA